MPRTPSKHDTPPTESTTMRRKPPRGPEEVKAEARAYADRTVKRAAKGEAYPSDLWFTAYVRRWRALSGLSKATPGPVATVTPIRRKRSA